MRKLIADVIESNLQSAIARSPAEYRRCERVLVTNSEVDDDLGGFTVSFE